MRPYLVTPQGAGTAELYLSQKDLGPPQAFSLLRAWQDVRNWRRSLLECDPENSSDVVHTHSFASGMAGVRNLSCVVYDLDACIEEVAISAGLCERGSWMGRSFRVAEQFILSRAQAVVVHSLSMKSAVEERGAAPEKVFLIPHPLPMENDGFPPFADHSFPKDFGVPPETVIYFVPHTGCSANGELPEGVKTVMQAYALVVLEVPQSCLLLELPPECTAAAQSYAESLKIESHVVTIGPNEALAVLKSSSVVVATGDLPEDQVKARQPNEICLRSLTTGKPLLAADVPRNRDASPEGTGCLWFAESDVGDIARRMVFLGHDHDFRVTLAASGRAHVLQTRGSLSVGRQYDAVYRYAISRKKAAGQGPQMSSFLPINCSI